MIKYLLAAIAVLAVALIATFWRLDNTSAALDASSRRVRDLESQSAAYEKALSVRDSIDSQYQEEIRNAEQSKPQLVDDLDAGVKRVYVRAACMPTNPKPAGSSHAAAPELAADARQDYANLVSAHAKVTAQVIGLQAFITQVCTNTSPK